MKVSILCSFGRFDYRGANEIPTGMQIIL